MGHNKNKDNDGTVTTVLNHHQQVMDLRVSDSRRRKAGFALAPILYMIALAGIAGTVLFTGYTQILRSNVEITADNNVRNQIRMASEVLSSKAILNGSPANLLPPVLNDGVYNVSFSALSAARLPKDASGNALTAAAVKGSELSVDVGGLPPGSGVRALDPWGRYYIYCRWESPQSPGTGKAMAIISAGADGKLGTTCSDTMPAASSDDRMEFFSVANVMSRAATWQATGDNTYRFGMSGDPSSARVVVGVDDASADSTKTLDIGGPSRFRDTLQVDGALTVNGETTMNTVNSTTTNTTNVNATSVSTSTINTTGNAVIGGAATISGTMTAGTANVTTLTATGTSNLKDVNATGNANFANISASGTAAFTNVTASGSLGVAGATTLSTLSTTGAATLASANITGGATVGGGLTATGGITTNSISSSGTLTVGGSISSSDTVSAPTGNFTNMTVSGTIAGNVSGSAGSVPAAGITGILPLSKGGTGLNAASINNLKDQMGLLVGRDIQGFDADLQALADNSTNGFLRRTGSGTVSAGPILGAEVPAFQGATALAAGSLGGVPAPIAGQQGSFLRGDGTWATISTSGISDSDSQVQVDDANGVIKFIINGSEQVRITETATANQSIRLTGGKNGAPPPELSVYGAATNIPLQISSKGTGNIALRTNNTDRLVIDGSTGLVTAAGGFSGNLTGNASTATKLATARNFSITGDVTASAVSFDGSANAALMATVGKIQSVTVSATTPTNKQALIYNGTVWAPADVSTTVDGGTIGTGSGIDVMLADGTAGTPSLRFKNSPTTGIYRAGTDILGFSTAGVNRANIDATGNFLVGTLTPISRVTFDESYGGVTPPTPRGINMALHSDSAHGSTFFLRKSRGTIAAPTAVQLNDNLGNIYPEGFDGTAYQRSGYIGFVVDKAVSSGNVPTAIRFNTSATNGDGTERMRISSAGNVGIGVNDPKQKLHISGLTRYEADSSTTCDSNATGSIRWNGTKFQSCNGTAWAELGSGAPALGSMFSGFPDAIYCNQGGSPTTYWIQSVSATDVFYMQVGNQAQYIRYTGSGAYITSASSNDCQNLSIAQLYGLGKAFDLVGGNGTGGVVNPLYLTADGSNNVALGVVGTGTAAQRQGLRMNATATTGVVQTIALATAGNDRLTIDSTGNVGIGKTPTSPLDVNGIIKGQDQVIVSGTYGAGTDPGAPGAGTRMAFYANKGAFRAGYTSGTHWDSTNIGPYSFAAGNNTIASGSASVAMGSNITSSGVGSAAFGSATSASNGGSFASGIGSNASGQSSTAMGNSTTASGDTATAFGRTTQATGINSTAMGRQSVASGEQSFAAGDMTLASSYNSFAIGRANVGGGTATSWVVTDPLFEIGIGANTSSRENALTVLKNGNVGIGQAVPLQKLHLAGAMRFDTDATTCGTNATGSIHWNGTAFEWCDGSTWQAFGTGSGGGGGGGSTAGNWKLVNIGGLTGYGTYPTVAYAGSNFYVMGSGSKYASSNDGYTWGNGTSFTGSQYVVTANNLYFASSGGSLYVGSSPASMSYVDVSSATSANPAISMVAYGNGKYVAVTGAYSGETITSSNGTSWTTGGNTNYSAMVGLAYGAGKFIGIVNTGVVVSSTNGASWSVLTTTPTTYNVTYTGLVYASGKFVASYKTSSGGGGTITSTDGTTWTKNPGAGLGNGGITYVGNRFFAMCEQNNVCSSSNGVTWVTENMPSFNGASIQINYSNAWVASNGTTYVIPFSVSSNAYIYVGTPGGSGTGSGGGGSGSGTPTGNDKEIQFNDGGAWGSDDQFVWDKTNDRLGIKVASPTVPLDVGGIIKGQDQVIVSGTYGAGTDPGAPGAGSRMAFYANKAAFRAGAVSGTQWDSANIGNYSTALNINTTASGSFAVAMNNTTVASGASSIATGISTIASGSGALSTNYSTTASGEFSAAFGYGSVAQAYNSAVFGRYNVGGGTTTSWVATDPLFEVGIGTGTSAKANAVTVLKNGKVGIGTATPNQLLELAGGVMRFGTDTTTTCGTNASGSIRWNGTALQVCDGTSWAAVGGSSGGSSGTGSSSGGWELIGTASGSNPVVLVPVGSYQDIIVHASGSSSNSYYNVEYLASSGLAATVRTQTNNAYYYGILNNPSGPGVISDNASPAYPAVVTQGSGNAGVRLTGYQGGTLYSGSLQVYGRYVGPPSCGNNGPTLQSVTGYVSKVTDGNYDVYTFTSSGSIQFVSGSNATEGNKLDYLIVGAGGGGGPSSQYGGAGGGGGGGEVKSGSLTGINYQTFTVNIGNGGSSGSAGQSSDFNGITANGGNAGATYSSGASGNSNAGGANYYVSSAGRYVTGGGGGAGGAGVAATASGGGLGGAGVTSSITGTALKYGGGGGGGGVYVESPAVSVPAGSGQDGGGNGSQNFAGSGMRGGGGGGAGVTMPNLNFSIGGGSGGNGTVIIRVLKPGTACSGGSSGGSGGSGSSLAIAGADKQIMFNDGGTALGASSTFVWDKTNSRLGVNVASPTTTLDVGGIIKGTDQVVVSGTYGAGTDPGAPGAGTRMAFYSSKAAFRAGLANSTQWDSTNMGGYSAAFGANTTASGLYSVAMGNNSIASGTHSLALGTSTASGNYSIATGGTTTASGNYALTGGANSVASGLYSVALGNTATATGQGAFALGESVTAQAYDSVVIGRFNVGGGTTTSWVATDPLFEVGIGTSSAAKANALTVLKNGNVGIGQAVPLQKLHIAGAMRFDTDTTTCGTNATGSIHWNGTAFEWCDGSTWQAFGGGSGGGGSAATWQISSLNQNLVYKIYYYNGKYVTLSSNSGNKPVYSTDTTAWTAANLPSLNSYSLNGQGLLVTSSGFVFYASTNDGNSGQNISGLKVWKSVDGVTWTGPINIEPDINSSTTGMYYGQPGQAAYCNGIIALWGYINGGGGNYYIYKSTDDGASWSSSVDSSPNDGSSYYCANNKFFKSNNYSLSSSTNATSWTKNSISPYAFGEIHYGNGLYMTNAGSNYYTSTDGITWKVGVGGNLSVMAFGGGKFLARTSASTEFYSSADGITWNKEITPSFSASSYASYANNKFYVLGSSSLMSGTVNGGSSGGGSGGGAAVAGADKQIQFNDGGTALGASSSFVWDKTNSRLGVGVATPTTTLDVGGIIKGVDAVLVSGTYGAGTDPGAPGAGSRMAFYANKGAFRAGAVSGTQWDSSNMGGYSAAFGANTIASGAYGLAFGGGTTASGSYGIAGGLSSVASGMYGIALGNAVTASGQGAAAFGESTTAQAYDSFVIGRFNVGGGTTTSWVATDPLFEVGIGTSSAAKANALTVLKNGNIGIGQSTPTQKLHLAGAMRFDTDTTTCGTNATGSIHWNGTAFEWCDGTTWAAFGSGSGGGSGTTIPDVSTWTSQTIAGGSYNTVAYGNGKFVAMGNAKLATSTDGVTWTVQTPISGFNAAMVTFGGGVFVAVSAGNSNIATSSDGINWTTTAASGVTYFSLVGYANGKFVAVGTNSSSSRIAVTTSTNGTTWSAGTTLTNLPQYTTLAAIGYVNNTWIISGSSPYNGYTAAKSTDGGVTWTDIGSYSYMYGSFVNDGGRLVGIGFMKYTDAGGGDSYAGTKSVFTDITNANPTSIAQDAILGQNQNAQYSSMAYGAGIYVASIAASNAATYPAGAQYIVSSIDGNSWTARQKIAVNSFAFGAGRFVGVNTSGTIYTSGTTTIGGGSGGSGSSLAIAGADKQIQFNDGGTALGASSSFVWDKTNSRLGVNVASPTTTLDVGGIIKGQDQVIVSGTYGAGTDPGAPGAGTRMAFYSSKAAFRAGYVSGTMWDSGNIGNYSTAFGYNTIASGAVSTAFGDSNSVTGSGATVFGFNNVVSGNFSVSFGTYNNVASYGSAVFGRYNVGGGTATSWVATDPLFEIGNGTSGAAKANAFTVLKNGNTAVGSAAPTTMLDVNGPIRTRIDSGSTCSTVGAGTIRWNGTAFQGCDGTNWATLGGGSTANVAFTDQIAVTGTYGSGTALTATPGAGARMVFNSNTASFRAGGVNGTQWDAANVGAYSFAANVNNKASGTGSTAFGANNNVTGNYSIATGSGGSVLADYATTIGQSNTIYATGTGGFAGGAASIVQGAYGFAFGPDSAQVSSYGGVAIGRFNALEASPTAASWVATDYLFSIGIGTSGAARANAMTVLKNGKIGIGTVSPATLFDVNGAVRIANDATTCAAGIAGALRWTGSAFEGCNGTAWAGFVGAANPALTDQITVSGTYGSGTALATPGAGTRLVFNSRVAAFRAGTVTGTQWDVSNIGAYSFAAGYNTTVAGTYGSAFGVSNTASGGASFATGSLTVASGSQAGTFGTQTTASGVNTVAMGEGTNATAYDSFAIGRFNVGSGTTSSWVATDAVFEIGNGTSGAAKANAFTVLKNGNTAIGGATPTTMLDVNGPIRTRTDSASTCSTVGAGTIRWNGSAFQGCDGTSWATLGGSAASDQILISGTGGSGTVMPSSGAGTRMIFNSNKQAFRAGYVSGTQWDAANVGNLSMALGYNITASGAQSVGLGSNLTASGTGSVAIGESSYVNSNYGTAIGYNPYVSGLKATAIGSNVQATGESSTAMGLYTYANSYASTAIGRYNVGGGTAGSWVATDPLFEVGNGTGTGGSASNAFTVLKNGNVGIGYWLSSNLTEKLVVNGNVKAAAFINTSDARLKKDIRAVEGTELIKKLRGVRFTWKSNGEAAIGLIAQEVETVAPELVRTDGDGFKSVMYANLVAPLIEAVKDVITRVDELSEKVAVLFDWKDKTDERLKKLEERLDLLEEQNQLLKQENARLKAAR